MKFKNFYLGLNKRLAIAKGRFVAKFSGLALMLTVMMFFSACAEDEADARDAYQGSYRVNYEYVYLGEKFSGTYTLTVAKSATNDNDIILGNIDNWGESARATVSGNAITIPQQTISEIGISGSGILNGNVLNFSTQETQTGGTQINITQTGTKQ
jgi:hypothetical protein